jgi:hypothetical protein
VLRVDARALVPRLRAELAALLTGLTAGDWALSTACPGWSVHDVAAHLLGVELGNVSVRRDRWRLGLAAGEDLDAWLDVAREYMERYVHQQQIRDAAGRPPLGAAFTGPVLETAAHALPRALDPVTRPAGTVVRFTAEGEGGGSWHVVRTAAGWELASATPARAAACQARTTVEGALKLYAGTRALPR